MSQDTEDKDGLEILKEPEGIASVVTPIDPGESPIAFVTEEAADSTEGPDELGLEELEEVDLDEIDLVPPPLSPPPPPPVPKAVDSTKAVAKDMAAPIEVAPPLELKLVIPEKVSALDALLDGREKLDWKRRAEKLTQELALAESKTRIGELAYELGELYQRHLGDEASAVKAFGRALQADPSLRANLWAIRRIFYRRKLWPNLVKLIGAELRFAESDKQRADLHLERGRVLLEEVGDPKGAQESFETALALQPGSHAALLSLESIAGQLGDSELLCTTLQQLADACEWPERKVALLVELAREYRQGDHSLGQASLLLEDAARLDCLHDVVDRERAALARHEEDSDALAVALESRIAHLEVADANEQPNLREIIALRREQAQILAQGGNEDGAWASLQQALSLSPQEPLLLADLSDLAETLGRYEELAEIVEARESGEVDVGRSLGLALRRASALFKAGKQAQADQVLEAKARSIPGYLPLLAARELSAGREKDLRKQAALQVEYAEALRDGTTFGPGAESSTGRGCDEDPKGAAQHYLVSGDLLRFGVEDATAAAECYGLALEMDPSFQAAADALVSLCVATGEFDNAAGVLESQLAPATGGRRDSLLAQLAALYLVLEKPGDELRVVEAALETSQEDVALRGRRIELLRQQKSLGPLVTALTEQAALLADTDAQASLFFEAGRLLDGPLERPDRAVECFSECAQRWPGDPIVAMLELQALRRAADWVGLASRLQAQVEVCTDKQAAEYGREALGVLEFQLGDFEAARDLAIQLCDRVPDDVMLLLDALACVDRERSECPEAGTEVLADVLERLVLSSEGDLQVHALLRLGMVSKSLGREAEAEHALGRAAEVGSIAALLALHHGAVAQGDHEAAVSTLGKLAATIPPGAHRCSILQHAGWESALRGDDAVAQRRFQEAQEMGGDTGALLGLGLLAAKSEERGAQGNFLEELADGCKGASVKNSLLLHSAMLAEVEGDAELADARLRKARSFAPQDSGAAIMMADRLTPLCPKEGENISELLERAELCDMRAVLAQGTPSQVDWELDRARALEQAGHLGEAAGALSSVLDRRPGHIRALQALRRVCIRGGDRAGQARACVALARQHGDSQGRLSLFREAVQIFDDEAKETSESIAVYVAILSEDPGADEFARLVSLLQEHDDTRGLYRAYTARLKQLDTVGDRKATLPLLLLRSRLRSEIGDIRGAARDLGALLEVDGSHPEALFERAQLLESLGEDREAAGLLQSFLEIEVNPTRRAGAERALSHLLADSLDDLAGAIEQLEHLTQEAPEDVDSRSRLVSLLVKAKRIDEATAAIRGMAGLRSSDGQRARDELRIASLQRGQKSLQPGQKSASSAIVLESLSRARQYDALNMDAVRELIDAYERDGRMRAPLIASAVADLRGAIADSPAESGLYEKLFLVARWGEDEGLQRQALSALEMLSTLSTTQVAAHATLGELPGRSSSLSEREWQSLTHSDAGGFVSQLWGLIGAAVAEVSGGTPAHLGFERGDRHKGKAIAKQMPGVAQMASVLVVEPLEVYLASSRGRSEEGKSRGTVGRAICGRTPTICLGSELADATSSEEKFSLARCLAYAKAGTGGVAELDDAEIALYFAAAAELADVHSLPLTLVGRASEDDVRETARKLSKALGRRGRKELTLLASRFSESDSPLQWKHGVESSAARAALLLCGSLRAAFDILDVGKGGHSLADSPVARDLLTWCVSEEFLALVGGDGVDPKEKEQGRDG